MVKQTNKKTKKHYNEQQRNGNIKFTITVTDLESDDWWGMWLIGDGKQRGTERSSLVQEPALTEEWNHRPFPPLRIFSAEDQQFFPALKTWRKTPAPKGKKVSWSQCTQPGPTCPLPFQARAFLKGQIKIAQWTLSLGNALPVWITHSFLLTF